MSDTVREPFAEARGSASLVVGGWYIIDSKVGIPRRVRVRGVSPCGRYVQYSFSSFPKIHVCEAGVLRAETQNDEAERHSEPNPH